MIDACCRSLINHLVTIGTRENLLMMPSRDKPLPDLEDAEVLFQFSERSFIVLVK